MPTKFPLILWGAVVLAGWLAAPAEEPREEKPAPDVLVLTLRDKSVISGVPELGQLTVITPYGRVNVELKHVDTIAMLEDRENGRVVLRNGDRLQGVLVLPAKIELKTVCGRIAVPVAETSGIAVLAGGRPAGLLLWNRLDGARSLVGPNVEFVEQPAFVEGREGRAVQLAGNNRDGFRVPCEMLKDAPRGTIEFWRKVARKPATVSHGAGPTYTCISGPLNLQYNANDGAGHGKWSLGSGGCAVFTETFGNEKSTDLLGADGQWIHYAVVWDREGLKEVGGAKLAFFINGKPHGQYASQPEARPFATTPEQMLFHHNRNGFGATMVYDELRIWDRVISDFAKARRAMGDVAAPGDVRLSVELRDGSRVLGLPVVEAVRLKTKAVGALSVPPAHLFRARLEEGGAAAEVELQNGDRLQGALEMADFPLKTVMGDLKFALKDILSIEAVPSGQPAQAARAAADAAGGGARPALAGKVQLLLVFADGSELRATPRPVELVLTGELAQAKAPYGWVDEIVVAEGGVVTASFRNGDRLTGKLTPEKLEVKTLSGEVMVPVAKLRRLTVVEADEENAPVLAFSFDKQDAAETAGRVNGEVVGPVTFGEGIQGKAPVFSSRETRLILRSPKLNMDGWRQVTVSAWVKMNSYSTYGNVLTRGAGTQGSGCSLWVGGNYGHWVGGGFGVSLGSKREDAKPRENVTAEPATFRNNVRPFPQQGVWYHLVGTYDGRKVRMYVNGKLDGEQEVKTPGLPIWDLEEAETHIANCATLPVREWMDAFFPGAIDDIRIWKRALREKEVERLYEESRRKTGGEPVEVAPLEF